MKDKGMVDHKALEGIAEAMAKLDLDKVKGYKKKKKKKSDDDDDDDECMAHEDGFMKVLEATKD